MSEMFWGGGVFTRCWIFLKILMQHHHLKLLRDPFSINISKENTQNTLINWGYVFSYEKITFNLFFLDTLTNGIEWRLFTSLLRPFFSSISWWRVSCINSDVVLRVINDLDKKTTSQTYKEVQMNSAQWLKTPVTWMTENLQIYFYGIVLIILIMIIAQALSIKYKAGFSIQIIKMWLKRRLSSLIPWILQTHYINCLGSTTFLNV